MPGVSCSPRTLCRRWVAGVLLAVCAWSAALCAAAQSTIHVPAEQPTIQAGIDAAQNGDTVLVAPGTYTENLDFKGKSIVVTSGAKSFADAATATTILSGLGTGPAVVLDTQETTASVLNGFTIENGTSAVYLRESSATLSNNVMTQEDCGVVATGAGASPIIVGNNIKHSGSYAGPMAYPTCILLDEPYAYLIGGGYAISLYEAGDVQILGNTIENNGTYGNGGGER